MRRLNCGVVGLGRLGYRHAETLAGRVPGARLVAVSDPVRQKLDSFVDQFPVTKAYIDYHDLIDSKEIDAVVIASPTNTHGRVIREAIAAGKQMFCEKPLTLDMDEAAALKRDAERRKPFIQVGFMRRFDPAYVTAKARLVSAEMGEPVFVRCTSRDPAAPPADFARTSGGLFMDLCVHDIDLARWLMAGEIEQKVTGSS